MTSTISASPPLHTIGDTVEDHLEGLGSEFKQVTPLNSRHLIRHGGRDAFDDEQAARFRSQALAMERDLGVTVGHDTHRLRILYNP